MKTPNYEYTKKSHKFLNTLGLLLTLGLIANLSSPLWYPKLATHFNKMFDHRVEKFFTNMYDKIANPGLHEGQFCDQDNQCKRDHMCLNHACVREDQDVCVGNVCLNGETKKVSVIDPCDPNELAQAKASDPKKIKLCYCTPDNTYDEIQVYGVDGQLRTVKSRPGCHVYTFH